MYRFKWTQRVNIFSVLEIETLSVQGGESLIIAKVEVEDVIKLFELVNNVSHTFVRLVKFASCLFSS